MAIYQKYGFAIDQILSEDQALPNATTGDSTNTIKLDAVADDGLHIVVCAASTTVELASGASLEIRPKIGATDGAVTTVLPSILIKPDFFFVRALPSAIIGFSFGVGATGAFSKDSLYLLEFGCIWFIITLLISFQL